MELKTSRIMRDPKRIRAFCNRLAAAWERVPDWRFGQLICNVLGEMGKDPFFPEDDEMIEFIESKLCPSKENQIHKVEENKDNA